MCLTIADTEISCKARLESYLDAHFQLLLVTDNKGDAFPHTYSSSRGIPVLDCIQLKLSETYVLNDYSQLNE